MLTALALSGVVLLVLELELLLLLLLWLCAAGGTTPATLLSSLCSV